MRLTGWAILLCSALLVGAAGAGRADGTTDAVQKAHALWESREYAAGLEVARSISTPAPDPQVLKVTGECYMGLKKWTQAIKFFEQILTCPDSPFRPQDVKSWIMECYVENGESSNALRTQEKLVADYPNDASTFYYLLGRRYQWTRQYVAGAEQFAKVLKMPTTDPLAREVAKRYMCCCLSSLDFEKALAYLPTFISDYPDAVPEILGSELERWKFKTPAAIQVVEKAVSEAHGDKKLKLKIGLADAYAAIKDWDVAASLLDSVPEEFRASSAQWHAAMAKCEWGRDRYAQAIAQLKEAVKLESTPQLRRLLMEYHRDAGEWDGMLAAAQALEKEWPDKTGEWRLDQGWAYLDMKQYDKAVPTFREVMSRFPDQRWIVRCAYISLAECLYRLGKGEEASREVKVYYEGRPELRCDYQFVCAQVMYFGARDKDASLAAVDKFLDECASDTLAKDARQFMVRVLYSAGREEEAASALEATAVDIPAWNTWDQAALLRQAAGSHFRAKNYQRAAQLYDALAKPDSGTKDERAYATYRLALCEHEMGHSDAAIRLLRKVIADFPNTPAARQASGSLVLWTEFGREGDQPAAPAKQSP